MGVPYALIPTLVFWFLIIRIWILHGRNIPLVFIGLWIAGRLTLHVFAGSSALGFPLFVCILGIVLAVIDRAKSLSANPPL
jgi:hypothetical protein